MENHFGGYWCSHNDRRKATSCKSIFKEDSFLFTYGDGIGNVNIKQLIEYHKSTKGIATVTAVYPPGRFGALQIMDNKVVDFKEKPKGDNSQINGGFFILDQSCFDYIDDDSTSWRNLH